MKCPHCGIDNRDGRRYCAECGAPLARACVDCGFVNEPRESFCGGCGKSIAGDRASVSFRAPREPERRQLTVMFCDLVGSTALSHRLDPEDLREVIGNYQEWVSQAVVRYEGYVARYMGDGMLVYFGYPGAHENDAARAIDAALEIIATLDPSGAGKYREQRARLSVRIGIATGLVVVGDLVREGALEEAAVMGETPNVAARLQTLAKPNSVVVTQATRDLAGGLFEYSDQGMHKLKGLRAPVQVWRVLRPSDAESRFDAAHGHHVTSFVGREAENEQLLQAWQRAQAGEGQVILVLGEAGIGKSRLAENLGERIAGSPYTRLLYQCSPYYANSALHPFIHHFERAAGLARRDSPERKFAKLASLLAKSGLDDEETVALVAALLSVPTADHDRALLLTPEQQKSKTLAALLDGLRRQAERMPMLLLFEDAHWIDPTSTELLNLLVHQVRDLPVFALVTSRTAIEHPWASLPHVSTLRLERLDRQQSATLVRQFSTRKRFPTGWVDKIVSRADGVPLYIEELTRALASAPALRRGASAKQARRPEIPSTLQDSLMARLDQLGSAREVAQLGAVIGHEFTSDLLAVLSPLDTHALSAALTTLSTSGLVIERGESRNKTYVFKHALVHDAAYASLLRDKRRELHEGIARAMEASHLEHTRAEPEVVAHHYTQAGCPLPAARYWAAAARRSIDLSANVEALGHATTGLEALADIAQSVERDHLELALEVLRGAAYRAIRGFASSDAERSFLRAQALGQKLGDARALIDVRRGLFSCYYARGALALAREQAEQVARAGREMNDSNSQMLGHWMLGCVTFWQGEFATARRELEEAYALYDPNEQRANTLALQIDPGVNALCHLSWVLWLLGFPDQAVQTSDKALATARELAQPFAVAMALFFACTTRASCGQHDAMRPLVDELTTVSAAHKLRYLGSCAHVLKSQSLIAHDHFAAGLEQIDRAFAEFAAQEAGVGLPWAMSFAVEAYTRMGRTDEALATLTKALAAVERSGERHWQAELLRLQGDLAETVGPADEAEAESCYRRAIAIARDQGAKSLELRATMSLARLLERQGKLAMARDLVREIRGSFAEGPPTLDMHAAGQR